MKTVIRNDRGELRKPRITPQGFLRVDGHVARAGIYEYRNDDGSPRLELRPIEEVMHADSLASYDAAPITVDHPVDGEVTAENVRRHEVGSVTGAASPDGDHVAAPMVIKDAKAIKLARGGKHELSPGYKVDLDERPGSDSRYAYPGNPTGRYDAVQRKIRVNHVALVDHGRGGPTVRLRLDSTDRADSAAKMTNAVNGHQHLLELVDWNRSPRWSGDTSHAMSDGAEMGHCHPWIRGDDGTITIGESDGHTHTLIDEYAVTLGQFDRPGSAYESGRMDKDEQIRSLKAQLAAAEAKLAPVETTAAAATTRADSAEAHVKTLQGEIADLRAQIAAAAVTLETEAIKREKIRADAAEAQIRAYDSRFDAALDARVALERSAAVVMPELNMRGLPDRQIIATIVKRLDAQQDTGPAVSDAYLRGRFDSLIDLHQRNARSLRTVSEVVTQVHEERRDSIESKRREMRDWGTEPLPNSREAQAAATARGRA